MSSNVGKRDLRKDLLLASTMVAAGLVVSGFSLAEIIRNPQTAQATQPLQSTPGAETKPSAPATTGTRPAELAPQPAHPDEQTQKEGGATPALPPAPAEKIAPPI